MRLSRLADFTELLSIVSKQGGLNWSASRRSGIVAPFRIVFSALLVPAPRPCQIYGLGQFT
jgi:hypothetical protein